MNSHPFDEQHQKFSDAYQQQQQQQYHQHQQMNYVVDNSKAQWQPKDDAFDFWNSPNASTSSGTTSITATGNSTLNILRLHEQSQGCNPKNQPLVTSSSIPIYPTYSNVPTTHNYQFSGGPYPSSTTSSFDPFSGPPSTMPMTSVAAPPIAATQHQLIVPITQSASSTVAWSADPYDPSRTASSHPIMQQYDSQQTTNNNQHQHGPTHPNHHSRQQNLQTQQQQLVPTDWYAKENAATNNHTKNNFIGQNHTANPSILLPPTIRRSTTPTMSTTSQRYNNYTLETSPPRNTSSSIYNDGNYSSSIAAATATATTTAIISVPPSASASIPPSSPPRDVNERQLQMSHIIAQKQRLPPDSSPLPNIDDIVSSGHVLSRISFRTIVLKRWKQTYWVQYGPHTLLLFRSLADYQDWLTNPYHTAKMRDYLIKLKIDFCKDLLEPGVMGYQITQANRKGYERGEPIM